MGLKFRWPHLEPNLFLVQATAARYDLSYNRCDGAHSHPRSQMLREKLARTACQRILLTHARLYVRDVPKNRKQAMRVTPL
jgi:hypothetical protein